MDNIWIILGAVCSIYIIYRMIAGPRQTPIKSTVGSGCLFSGISGVIRLDGKPAAGAQIKRRAKQNRWITDETVSDENGYFTLPPMFYSTILNVLPQEFAVTQVIEVIYEGNTYKMWSGVKRRREENAESRGKPLVVECELISEEKLITVNNGPIFSLCTWDVEPDPRFDFSSGMFVQETDQPEREKRSGQ